MKDKNVEFEEVLSTFNLNDIAIIKSVFDSQELVYFFQGENFNQLLPFVEPARLMVRKEDVARAREILKELNLKYTSLSEYDESEE